MGKRVLLIVAIVLALPIAAMADSDLSFAFTGGSLTGTSFGMSVSGDQLVSITGLGGNFSGTNLGTLAFSTGIAVPGDGSVITGITYAAGGSVLITGNGSNGAPSGVLFSGTFISNPTWTRVQSGGNNIYTFSGIASGTLADGSTQQFLVEFTLNKGSKVFPGTSSLSGVTVSVVRTPEPGSIAFIGMGIAGLTTAIRRKRKKEALAS
jgi:PEP-CTERM motif